MYEYEYDTVGRGQPRRQLFYRTVRYGTIVAISASFRRDTCSDSTVLVVATVATVLYCRLS